MEANASVSYTHLRAHETVLDLVCRLLLEKKKKMKRTESNIFHQFNPNIITLLNNNMELVMLI